MSASRIAPKLYQGSLPPYGAELASRGFHTVVLCAVEFQPADNLFPGVEVLRCPYEDRNGPLTRSDWERVSRMATAVAARVRREKRTLVTCAAGLNRSGLVTALALTELYGCSGTEATTWVRREREGALFNQAFVAYLARIPARHARAATIPPEPLILLP